MQKGGMFGFVVGCTLVAGSYLRNRFGYNGGNNVRLCIHEQADVNHGWLWDSYSYKPKDCYVTVVGTSIRPLVITYSDDECFGFGDECMALT